MSAEPSYLDEITTQLVETAILEFDSETLIAAFKDRVAGLAKTSLNGTQIVQIASEFSAKVGDVIAILFGERINAAKDDTIVDAAMALSASIEATVVETLTRGSEIGFEIPIKPHTDLLFRILQVPDEPVVAEVAISEELSEISPVKVDDGTRTGAPSTPISPAVPSSTPLKTRRTQVRSMSTDELQEDDIVKKLATSHESDPLRAYCRQIGKYDLITPTREVELAELIKKGYPEARHEMICANLRFVVKIAHDYENYGLPIMDLISEGNIGLMKAVERFDPNKGGKLSTYAAWWIKQSIKRALANQSKTIRLPVHMVDKIAKMRRVEMAMSEELGREPNIDELAEEIGIDRAKLSQLKVASMRPASLDAPVSEDDDTEFGELVGDENADDPLEKLVDKNMLAQLDELLDCLDERERKIIDARFGLNGQKARTLEEVGQEFSVTRERIRQLQNIAIKKMAKKMKKKEDPLLRQLLEESDPEGDKKTSRSILLSSDFLKKAAAQLAAHKGRKGTPTTPKKPAPAPSLQRPAVSMARPPLRPAPSKKPKPAPSKKIASSTGPGNVIHDHTTRVIMRCYYLGESGCLQEGIPGIADNLEIPVADVRATLADMGILRG